MLRFLSFFALLVAINFVPTSSFGIRQQSVGARGRLFCGDKPASNVLIKLFDKDTGRILCSFCSNNLILPFFIFSQFSLGLDPDDELDKTRTDSMGNFQVQGDERETTNIDPELKIYHDCNKGLNVRN